ncbi:hypothetical protein ACM39_02555 [Chryseobacterium sp. FH2]|uniref:hypothetical protein n=1 Tax=Chryseobacterium sp. FH2 TaxID=1674291 RepID=UPI00065AED19|nr:hypothetical protein [Chryseobacterium sp. FH2]KMQ69939.1 hypothetical protein ACM39_02555 [Chryseobacterium sp. FH2]
MKTILESIQTRLSTITEFNYIGEDWGQLNTDPLVTMNWPCCIYNISRGFYNDLGKDPSQTPKNRQTGKFRLKLNIANPRMDTTNENWIEHDLMEKVHIALHGFSPLENCSVLKRNDYKRLKRNNGMIIYKVIYTFEVINI